MNPTPMLRLGAIPTLAALLALAGPALRAPAQEGPVRYELDLARAHQQRVGVSITLSGVASEAVDLHLPVWRPGLYLVLDQSGTIDHVQAEGADGGALRIEKVDKATWRVATGGSRAVTVRYSVFAGSLENRTRHADDTHVFVSPSSVMMYSPAWRSLPAEVKIAAPEGWTIATGLEASTADPSVLLAPDYDVLVDSPIEIGRHHVREFEFDGARHQVVVWTGERDQPAARLHERERYRSYPADVEKIVRVQRDIFGSLPYKRYVILLHVYPLGRGGTEHLNSTVMQTRAEAFETADAYRRLLSLTAHEVFHTWNVKRFRPAGLVPYDYQRENYTDLLWLAEGTTSYYEDLTLCRAGLRKPADALKDLAKAIDDHRRRPGSRVQSLAASSFDAWVKFNRRTPDAGNTTVSFYDKGALASLVMDMEIRRRTDGRASLDTLMRALYERFPTPVSGYASHDVKNLLREIAGDFEAFFAEAIDGTSPLDFDAALGVVGLRLERKAGSTDDAKESKDEGSGPRTEFGAVVKDQAGLPTIESVDAGGPADLAGLIVGDTIVAVDGVRARADGWDRMLKQHKPGESVRVTYFRHDLSREATVTLGEAAAGTLRIIHAKDASPAQRAQYEHWLGAKWPKSEKPAPAEDGQEATEDAK